MAMVRRSGNLLLKQSERLKLDGMFYEKCQNIKIVREVLKTVSNICDGYFFVKSC